MRSELANCKKTRCVSRNATDVYATGCFWQHRDSSNLWAFAGFTCNLQTRQHLSVKKVYLPSWRDHRDNTFPRYDNLPLRRYKRCSFFGFIRLKSRRFKSLQNQNLTRHVSSCVTTITKQTNTFFNLFSGNIISGVLQNALSVYVKPTKSGREAKERRTSFRNIKRIRR